MAEIDIIVGIKNEEEYIERCIRSLMNQNIKDITIIVVDGLSSDKTRYIVEELMEEDHRIKLLTNEAETISSGRNIGLNASKSKYVAYLDGHAYVGSDWLEKLYIAFNEFGGKCQLGGVGSTYASPEDDTPFGKTVAYCVQTLFGGLGTSFTKEDDIHTVETVAFAMYKRSLLEKETIFYDEKMTHCEDTDFNHQLINRGYVLLKHPQALVYQYRRKNISDFFRQMYKYGDGRYKLVRKYGETLRYYHLIPLFTIFYLIFAVISLILFMIIQTNLYYLILIWLPVFVYLIINILYTLTIIAHKRSFKYIYAFLIFPAIHLGYGFGFLKGVMAK
ncbi:MAG TPA: glycosyltransferase [Methanobacterium sp.]|nr:MAG: glycosyltransferase [Methanobacterium sp.]HOI71135.1 glycosyltransferase [Methanobacterium sp.]